MDDAMKKAREIGDAYLARALHGDDAHRAWLRETVVDFVADIASALSSLKAETIEECAKVADERAAELDRLYREAARRGDDKSAERLGARYLTAADIASAIRSLKDKTE
jgi:hypothetical protein